MAHHGPTLPMRGYYFVAGLELESPSPDSAANIRLNGEVITALSSRAGATSLCVSPFPRVNEPSLPACPPAQLAAPVQPRHWETRPDALGS